MDTIFDKIIQWNKDKNIPKQFDIDAEAKMLTEEHLEMLDAKSEYQLVDALADYIVVATGTMWKMGYDPNLVMEEVLKEINSRGGSFNPIKGKWEKIITGEEYAANYQSCRTEVEEQTEAAE